MAPPSAAPMGADTVLLIADPRLDGLRGQTLLVDDCQVAIPVATGPFPVPIGAARVLLMQVGWRLAPGQPTPVTLESPPRAPAIPNPQQTREGINRLQVAQVSSPSAAEMHARDSRQDDDIPGMMSWAAALQAVADVAEAAAAEPASDGAEHAAVPAPAVAGEALSTPPQADTDAAGAGMHATTPLDAGLSQASSDFGGSSEPLD